MLISLMMMTVAFAQDCDVAGMSADILSAGPHEAAPMFVRLADCDPAAAKRVAAKVVPSFIGEEEGFKGAVAAIDSGASVEVMDWMDSLQRDEQSRAIRAFGKSCEKSSPVQSFLISAEAKLGAQFWSNRWYRALTECRSDAIRSLLATKVGEGAGEDRGAFFGVVEAYAVNAGSSAISKLVELVQAEQDLEMQINLVGAFADAAQAGTVSGLNPKIAEQAADAVRGLAPGLAPKAIEKARITLKVLLDEKGADEIVSIRYKDVLQDDGHLLYGTVVFENATCKNGKATQRYHVAEAIDPGQTWPDQLEEKVKGVAELNWDLNLAERCKGEGEVVYAVPEAPFANKEEMRKWIKEVIRAQMSSEAKKSARVDHDPINL